MEAKDRLHGAVVRDDDLHLEPPARSVCALDALREGVHGRDGPEAAVRAVRRCSAWGPRLLHRDVEGRVLPAVRLEAVPFVLDEPPAKLGARLVRAIHVEVGLGVVRALEELQCVRAGYERACAGLQSSEGERGGEEAREVRVNVEGAGDVRVHGGVRGAAGLSETHECRGRAKPEDEVVEQIVRLDTLNKC